MGEHAHGLAVRLGLAARTGRDHSVGAICTTLERRGGLGRHPWLPERGIRMSDYSPVPGEAEALLEALGADTDFRDSVIRDLAEEFAIRPQWEGHGTALLAWTLVDAVFARHVEARIGRRAPLPSALLVCGWAWMTLVVGSGRDAVPPWFPALNVVMMGAGVIGGSAIPVLHASRAASAGARVTPLTVPPLGRMLSYHWMGELAGRHSPPSPTVAWRMTSGPFYGVRLREPLPDLTREASTAPRQHRERSFDARPSS